MQPKDLRLATEQDLENSIGAATAPLDQRLEDLEVSAGFTPGDINDTTAANLIRNPNSETATELSAAIDEKVAPAKAAVPLTHTAEADRWLSAYESRKAYDAAASIVESWAGLTGWSSATFAQVSAGRLYSNGQGANSGANRSFTVTVGEAARVVASVRTIKAAGGSGGTIVGFTSDTAGGAFTAGAAKMRGLYFRVDKITSMTDGVEGATILTLPAPDGSAIDWTVTLTVDDTYVSAVAVSADGTLEARYRWARAGFAVNNVAVFNSDARLLSGASIGPLGARKSTVTVTPRAGIEGVQRTVQWTAVSGANIRIALPATYDSRKPSPVVILFHGNGSDETHFADNGNGKAVANAFIAAGYIAVSAAPASKTTWGAQVSLDAYYAAYQYVRDHYAVGPIVFYGNSMGGIESLLSLAERRIPGVVAWVATVPTANLAENHSNALFISVIRTAYGIAGDGSDYATKTAGHDPMLMDGSAFRGVPMYALVATDDASVTPSANWQSFEPIVAPHAREIVTVNVTGGHSTSQITSRAGEMVAFADKYAK